MDQLSHLSKVQVAWLCFGLVNALYLTGLLEWLRLVPFLSYLSTLPALIWLAALIRWYLEDQLGKKTIHPDGKAVLITGCDTGFGHLLAKRLAGDGFYVFAGCLFPKGEGALSLHKEDRIEVVAMDVTNDQSVQEAMEDVERRLDEQQIGLWAVVANAGIGRFCPLEWSKIEDTQKIFDVNVFGTIRTVKVALPRLRQSKGRVVATASMGANVSWPGIVPYCMSKAAIKSMVEGLRREQASFGVECITIEPGFYRTPIIDKDERAHHLERFDALPSRIKQDYSPLLEAVTARFDFIGAAASPHIHEPLAAFDHAITSVRPQCSYIVTDPYVKPLVTLPSHFAMEHKDAVLGIGKNPSFIKWLTGILAERHGALEQNGKN